jgi:hypothetical protein
LIAPYIPKIPNHGRDTISFAKTDAILIAPYNPKYSRHGVDEILIAPIPPPPELDIQVVIWYYT